MYAASGSPDNPSLGPNIQRGLRWSVLRQVITGLTGTIGAIAYTRILQPEDLGAFGLALLVYSGLFLLIEAPIRDAVVYYQSEGEVHGSAAFWLLVVLSTIAVALVLISADTLAKIYRSPLAAGLTRVMAIAFFLRALAIVPAALLLKHFRFAMHEGLQTVHGLILFAGWVVFAALGYGAWSLVIPVLLAAVFWAIAVWLAVKFRPVLRPGRCAYGDIFRFSRSLFGSKLITYIRSYIDNAAVGTLGESALGWYSLGEDQSAFAVVGVGMPIANIALPVLARVQEQLEEFKRIYLEMLRLTATLSTPMQIGAFVLADLGIRVIFGEQWMGAVPVFRAYLIFRLIDTLLVISNSATSAIGRPDVQFNVNLIQLPFFIAGTWFGLRIWGGINGVAWSLAIVRSVGGLIYFVVTMRITRLTPIQTSRYLLPSSLAAALMGVVVYALHATPAAQGLTASIDQPFVDDAISLLMLILSGVVAYLTILFVLDRAGFKDVASMAWQIIIPEAVRRQLGRKSRR